MTKILPILIAIGAFASSCKKTAGTIEVNDEKSKIIQRVFNEISEEKVDYLKEILADDFMSINSKGGVSDKAEFIDGIKEMYDLFDSISYQEVNGDADGAEIQTNYYSNGNVYSNIWNIFSAKGKYTGQKVTFGFHGAFEWAGDKIRTEYQLFDRDIVEAEANSKANIQGTNENVGFVLDLSINSGYSIEDLKAILEQLTSFVRANEPDCYDYGYFLSSDGTRVTLIEKFKTPDAAILHVDNLENGPNMKPFLETFTIESFILFGKSTNELQERIKAYGVEPRQQIGGWLN